MSLFAPVIHRWNANHNGSRIGLFRGFAEPILRWEVGGTRNLSADERGSIVAVSSRETGDVLEINRYDEFGKPGASNIGRFQYTGQMWLPEIGAYYYKARVYAPHLGRFLQPDPIGYEAGPNLYAYVGNDPINFIDPLGLCGETVDPDGRIIYTYCRAPQVPFGWSPFGNLAPLTITFHLLDIFKNQARRAPHEYVVEKQTLCAASEAFDKLKKPGVSAPGAPQAREGFVPLINLAGNNPISQNVSSSSMTITNTTLRGHVFFPGTVQIKVIPVTRSTSKIRIVGRGSGTFPKFNEFMGHVIFGSAARSVAAECSGTNLRANP